MRRLVMHITACALVAAGVAIVGCKSKPAPTPQGLLVEGSNRIKETIRTVVTDPDRRSQAIEILERYIDAETEFLAEASEFRGRITALHGNYETARWQYMGEVIGLGQRREAFAETIVQSWVALIDVLEDEEVQVLIAAQLEEEDRWRALIK